MPHLWFRAEVKPLEYRVALTPAECQTLMEQGFQISVEKFAERCIPDGNYEAVGCTMVETGSWKTAAPKDAFIVGLKELPENDTSPLVHRHIFFGHAYKGQAGADDLLRRFLSGGGMLLDLEFLTDENKRRVAAFGYMAGFAGAGAGLLAWAEQKEKGADADLSALSPMEGNALVEQVKTRLEAVSKDRMPRVHVIGALGRCGTGACDFATRCGITDIVKWDINETKAGGPFPEILESDLLINTIYLTTKIPAFLTVDMLQQPTSQLRTIVDVSCDTTNPNNPLPFVSLNTTFDRPTHRVPDTDVRFVSIDHLPSLCPRESSMRFAADLFDTIVALKDFETSPPPVWQRSIDLFKEKTKLL